MFFARVHAVLRGPSRPVPTERWEIHYSSGAAVLVDDKGRGFLGALDALSTEGWTLVCASGDGGWILTHARWPE